MQDARQELLSKLCTKDVNQRAIFLNEQTQKALKGELFLDSSLLEEMFNETSSTIKSVTTWMEHILNDFVQECISILKHIEKMENMGIEPDPNWIDIHLNKKLSDLFDGIYPFAKNTSQRMAIKMMIEHCIAQNYALTMALMLPVISNINKNGNSVSLTLNNGVLSFNLEKNGVLLEYKEPPLINIGF